MTMQPEHTADTTTAAIAVNAPAESWIAGRLLRIITAGFGLLLLGSAFLPLMSGGDEIAGELIRISDARLIFILLAAAVLSVNLFGMFRLGMPWVRSVSVLLGLFITLWAFAVLLEINEVGVSEPLGGASPGFGLWLVLVFGLAVIAVAAVDRGTTGYANALIKRASVLIQKGHVIRPARLTRTALRIALRRLGPDHAYTMFIASVYGTLLVAAGQGQRARKISDQLYPRYSALGTENTDPWFSELRFELSRKGL
ncbi:MAG: 34 kDa antigenic family protein [Leucobacter sp.]|jgi:hypothetical protein|nr:34 kDa antigenic family protein [Leucobacter sp.]